MILIQLPYMQRTQREGEEFPCIVNGQLPCGEQKRETKPLPTAPQPITSTSLFSFSRKTFFSSSAI